VAFIDRVLSPPSYGYADDQGRLIVPTRTQLLREFTGRLNVWRDTKNWLPLCCWSASALLTVPLCVFALRYLSWWGLALGFVYSMVLMGSHGTMWFHRYSTHRAYRFRNRFWRELCRNLVIKIIPEEIYVVSHHVHHKKSDRPGDPYNAQAGFLYCFLADANHQMVNPALDRDDYERLRTMLAHTGVRMNSYAQFQRWGSVCHPLYTLLHYALNWGVWYGIFHTLGGHALATALFGGAAVWAFGIRTFNFAGHGSGKDLRRPGVDFSREDLSINQLWPGFVAGEWHSNHHLYAGSARSGFLPHQLDLPWLFIRGAAALGVVTWFRDSRADFMRDYYEPSQRGGARAPLPALRASLPVLAEADADG
jgi:sn-1 stearoyl-lipid 9-desaturase